MPNFNNFPFKVPFVFSARLYPYGVKNGDAELVQEYNEFRPSIPIVFMGKTIEKIWVCFLNFKMLTFQNTNFPECHFLNFFLDLSKWPCFT